MSSHAAGTQRGVNTSKEQREIILTCADKLQQGQAGTNKLGGRVDATWKLLWTSEKVSA